MAGTAEYQVLTAATGTSALPAQYTGCHSHGAELFCFAPSWDEVELVLEGSDEPPSTTTGEAATPTGKRHCHYHNGVEHWMFTNKRLGELSYKSTTSAILLAGFFVSFLVDYLLQRFMLSRNAKTVSTDP